MSSNHTSTRTDQPEECGDGSSKPKKWYTNDKKTSIEVLRCDGLSTELNGFYHYFISFVPAESDKVGTYRIARLLESHQSRNLER
jgi:hypothetical protein